jgi:hypothetical protein
LFKDSSLTAIPSAAKILTEVGVREQFYMKTYNRGSCLSALVLAAGLAVTAFPAAGQSILIDINQADPSAVQFIATVNGSIVADSSQYNLYGVDLISYFTASIASGSAATAGNLIPAGTIGAYTQWHADNLNATGNESLNLYTSSVANPAFTGTAIIDLSSLLADLPTTGMSGNIYSGDVLSSGQVIGQWVVVPEPSVGAQLAFGAIVLAGLAFVRRARRAAVRQ